MLDLELDLEVSFFLNSGKVLKMQNGLAPDYLVDLVPPRVGNETPFVMLIIINKFMQILDCILPHFFLLRFEGGTIFPLM